MELRHAKTGGFARRAVYSSHATIWRTHGGSVFRGTDPTLSPSWWCLHSTWALDEYAEEDLTTFLATEGRGSHEKRRVIM